MDLTSLLGGSFALTILISLCIAIPFLAIAIWLIISARRSNAQAQASQSWPSVIGIVVGSTVTARSSTDSDGNHSTSYYPIVQYEYEVVGHTYRSDRVSFGFATGSRSPAAAQAIADRYVSGNKIRVYYEASNPGQAVLERTAGSSSMLKWVAVFIIAILCITIVPILLIMGGVFAMLNEVMRFIPK